MCLWKGVKETADLWLTLGCIYRGLQAFSGKAKKKKKQKQKQKNNSQQIFLFQIGLNTSSNDNNDTSNNIAAVY